MGKLEIFLPRIMSRFQSVNTQNNCKVLAALPAATVITVQRGNTNRFLFVKN